MQTKTFIPKDTSLTFSYPLNLKTEKFRPWGEVKRCGAHLHDVEEDFLPQAVLAFEELMLGVGAGDVSADELLAGGRHL